MSARAIDWQQIAHYGVHMIKNDEELAQRTAEHMDLAMKRHLTQDEEDTLALLTLLIETYENQHYPIRITMTPVEALKGLMEENGLKLRDLAKEIGSESLVSLILAGKRNLTVPQIQRLSRRFRVSPELFIPSVATKKKPQKQRAATATP
jgi:HTH-type transcriptional regulator/antitoxin HigA